MTTTSLSSSIIETHHLFIKSQRSFQSFSTFSLLWDDKVMPAEKLEILFFYYCIRKQLQNIKSSWDGFSPEPNQNAKYFKTHLCFHSLLLKWTKINQNIPLHSSSTHSLHFHWREISMLLELFAFFFFFLQSIKIKALIIHFGAFYMYLKM